MQKKSSSSTRGFGLFERFLARKRAECADRLIPTTHRVGSLLDVACGVPPLFLLQTTFAKKVGIDCRFTSAEHHLGITCIRHDMTSAEPLPLTTASIDVVTALAFVEHLSVLDLRRVFSEMRRIVRPHGIMILTSPVPRSSFLLHILSLLYLVSPEEIRDHKRLYTVEELTMLLGEAGFSSATIEHGTFECGLNRWIRARAS